MKIQKLLLALLFGSIPLSSAHALAVSSETKPFLDVNYGANVLNSILSNWQKPQADVSGVTAITIRIAKDGRPYSCEIRHHSSSLDADNSLCETVSQIGQFPPLKANDTGEVYLTFVHDNKPFLQVRNQQASVNAAPAITDNKAMAGNEQVDTVRNSVNSPIRELQKSSQVDVESSSIIEENVPLAASQTMPDNTNLQFVQNTQNIQPQQTNAPAAMHQNLPNDGASLPIATQPQPNTIQISRQEALQEPSKDLADPAQFVQAYSYNILRQASPQIRIPSNFSGRYQVVARIDVLGEGRLKNAQITKSSQNKMIDDEILRVLTQEVQYAPLPNKSEQSMWLTFNITK